MRAQATRIAAPDRPGALFKAPVIIAPRPRFRRQARQRDAEHLDAIRQCPCISCGRDPCGEAAHVRLGSHAGLGRKPNDRRATPLCHGCHMDQHAIGELTFWTSLGIAPVAFAERLYRLSPNVEAMRAACFVAHCPCRHESPPASLAGAVTAAPSAWRNTDGAAFEIGPAARCHRVGAVPWPGRKGRYSQPSRPGRDRGCGND